MLDSSSMVMSTPDILQTIIQRKRQDIQESMSLRPLASLRKEVESLETPTVVHRLSRYLASSLNSSASHPLWVGLRKRPVLLT